MIELKVNAGENTVRNLKFKSWNFPAGETGVKLEESVKDEPECVVLWSYESDNECFVVANLVDALRQDNPDIVIGILFPYLPYSRQDRVCHTGESFALKVFAEFINSLNLYELYTLDVHNEEVYYKLFNNAYNIPQEVCASMLPKYDYFIAPDAGAAKKIYKHRQVNYQENPTKVIVMQKTRVDGKVVYNALPEGSVPEGSRVCVVDDLADGAATFLALIDAINDNDIFGSTFDLYVTHGLFSNKANFETMRFIYDTIYVKNLMNPSIKHKVKEI